MSKLLGRPVSGATPFCVGPRQLVQSAALAVDGVTRGQGDKVAKNAAVMITARRVLNFKASQLLKQALNEGSGPAWPEGSAATAGTQNGQSSSGDGHR